MKKHLTSDKMKGIYLASHIALHPNYDIDYQDITGKRDIGGDMLDIDLTNYDFIIATPPCNYWSRARGNKQPSEYALKTKHLLPYIIDKLIELNKPFIVENVRNYPRFNRYNLFDKKCFIYEVGRHTYWTNVAFNPNTIKQHYDFKYGGIQITKNKQGGENVYNVIESWLNVL